MNYAVRYFHKISPSSRDVGPDVFLSANDVTSKKQLAEALRRTGVLMSGVRVRSFRVEKDGKIIVFPSLPGRTTYWHAVSLTPKMTRGERVIRRAAAKRTAGKRLARKVLARQQWLFADGHLFYTLAGAQRHASRTGLKAKAQRRSS